MVFRLVATTEAQEQEILARWLDAKRLVWFHAPNEGVRNARTGKHLKTMGMKAGVPDVLVFSPPPITHWPWKGIAIELKRDHTCDLSPAQGWWLDALNRCGWNARRCDGANEAIEFLKGLGY